MNKNALSSLSLQPKPIKTLELDEEGIPVIHLTKQQDDALNETYEKVMEDIKAGRFTTNREEFWRQVKQ